MRLTRIKTKIPNSPYITKKLDSETAQKLLDSSSFVVSGIYEIKNDAKDFISYMKRKIFKAVRYLHTLRLITDTLVKLELRLIISFHGKI